MSSRGMSEPAPPERAASQKPHHSLLEICLSTALGFGISFCAGLVIFPVFGWRITLGANFGVTAFYTVISIARGYAFRRLFNALHARGMLR